MGRRFQRDWEADHRGPDRRSSLLSVTDHAAERFVKRIAPGFTVFRARRELAALASSARKTGGRTPNGAEIWEVTDGMPFRLMVRTNSNGSRTIVTILLPEECPQDVDPEG